MQGDDVAKKHHSIVHKSLSIELIDIIDAISYLTFGRIRTGSEGMRIVPLRTRL